MNTQKKLNRIKEICTANLEIAAKRTPGEWKTGKTCTSIPAVFPDGTAKGNSSLAMFGIYKPGEDIDELENQKNNSTFISSCAGPAEAGWKATVSAIEHILTTREETSTWEFLAKPLAKSIISAWEDQL